MHTKQYEGNRVRNVAIVGAAGSGKTSLAEVLLFDAGAVDRLGKTEEGNTASDFDPEEVKRRISIHTALLPLEWKDYKINLIDTPGYADFVGEVVSALRVVDGLIFLFCGLNGIGVGADTLWRYSDNHKLPRLVFINRLDKERSDFFKVVEDARKRFSNRLVPLQIPIGKEAGFKGVVDLIKQKGFEFDKGTLKEVEVPSDLKDGIARFREMLIEALAEVDDTLLTDYLDNKEITEEELKEALKKGVPDGKVIPIFCGSAAKNVGIPALYEAILEYFPSPVAKEVEAVNLVSGENIKRKGEASEPFSAYVFKTTLEPHIGEMSYVRVYSGALSSGAVLLNSGRKKEERIGQIITLRGKNRQELPKVLAGDIAVLLKLKNTGTGDTLCDPAHPVLYPPAEFPEPVISVAVHPKSKGDQEKMGLALTSFSHEDPTFRVKHDTVTKETVISGMGELHLEIMQERTIRRFGVEITSSAPKIPYKEAIKGKAKGQGKYKKQSGGRGQYGDCWLEMEPLPRGKGYEFVDKIVGGSIPKSYIPSIEKGIKETMETGVIAGYPVVDVKAILYDGSYHEVDSSDMAFKIAGSLAFKKVFVEARPVILEPIMQIEVTVPPDSVGDITSDLNKRRGRIMGMEASSLGEIIKATAPLAEIAKYATDLRSITRGRGSFTTKFSHYEEVPASVQEELVNKYKKERAGEEE